MRSPHSSPYASGRLSDSVYADGCVPRTPNAGPGEDELASASSNLSIWKNVMPAEDAFADFIAIQQSGTSRPEQHKDVCAS